MQDSSSPCREAPLLALFMVEAATAAVAAAAVAVTEAGGDAVDIGCEDDSWVVDSSCADDAETGGAAGGTATVEEVS